MTRTLTSSDNSLVDMLGLLYKSVNFGAGKDLDVFGKGTQDAERVRPERMPPRRLSQRGFGVQGVGREWST